MKFRIVLRHLFLVGLASAAPLHSAYAAHVTMSGEDLDLTTPCMGQVKITVDPSLKDGASLDSSSNTQVMMRDGKDEAESKITIATRNCAPGGKLAIRISPNTGLSIHDSHDTHFTITGSLASLDASLDSDTMDMERVQSLDLSLHGTSSVHVSYLERAAQIVSSGTSTFTADNAQLSALSAQLTNNASLMINGGSIEALTIVTADQATATIMGNATVATVTANGSGVVNIEKVTGPLVRSGSGSLRVGAPNGEILRPTAQPPAAVQVAAPPVQPPAQPPASAPTAPSPPTITAPTPTIQQQPQPRIPDPAPAPPPAPTQTPPNPPVSIPEPTLPPSTQPTAPSLSRPLPGTTMSSMLPVQSAPQNAPENTASPSPAETQSAAAPPVTSAPTSPAAPVTQSTPKSTAQPAPVQPVTPEKQGG